MNSDPKVGLSLAVATMDIELGLKVIDGIGKWESMQEAVSFLEGLRLEGSSPASYLLAEIHIRYGRWQEAVDCYIESALSGLPSGYYVAAKLQEKHGVASSDGNWNYIELMRKGTASGHIWSRLAVLREQASNSLFGRVRFLIYRLLVSPIQIVMASVISSRRDRIRY